MHVSPTRALIFNEARITFIILRSIVPTMGNTSLYNVKGGGILGYIVLIMGNTSLYNVKGGGILGYIVLIMGNTSLYNVKGGGILGYIVLIMGNTSLYNVKGGGIPGKTFVTIFCNYLLPREERSLSILAQIIIISLYHIII